MKAINQQTIKLTADYDCIHSSSKNLQEQEKSSVTTPSHHIPTLDHHQFRAILINYSRGINPGKLLKISDKTESGIMLGLVNKGVIVHNKIRSNLSI